MKEIELSRYISYILRHNPSSINATLDNQGWCDVEELITGVNKFSKFNLDFQLLNKIVKEDVKIRYSFNSDFTKIRANQGHSLKNVNLGLKEVTPKTNLYHGTSSRFIKSILESGLLKRTRQYVHLTDNFNTALTVGKRHGGTTIILSVNVEAALKDGFKFYLSDNNVYLSDDVPVKYLKIENEKE